jgi:hypothetical protein
MLFAVLLMMAGIGGGRLRLGGNGGEGEDVCDESESPPSEKGLWLWM